MQKDFFKVTELSKEMEAMNERFSGAKRVGIGPEDLRMWQLELQLVQAEMQLAIAQQVTMVAQHLGSLVSMVKDEANRKGQG